MLGKRHTGFWLRKPPSQACLEEAEALLQCQTLLSQSLDLRSKNKQVPDLSETLKMDSPLPVF